MKWYFENDYEQYEFEMGTSANSTFLMHCYYDKCDFPNENEDNCENHLHPDNILDFGTEDNLNFTR